MKEKKGFTLPPYVMLMLVAVVMSFAIAGVYTMTKDTIETAALAEQEAARLAVMPDAAVMSEVDLEEGAPVDYCYEAFDANGELIGCVSQITVVGFGGEIEVTVGLDTSATITGISVGGKDFSETSGLGARTREPAFTEQFQGKSGMLVLKQNIDSVTGASISSGAVVSGVNKAVEYMKNWLPEDAGAQVEELPLTEEQIQELLPGAANVRWMGGGSGINGWWQADNGYIVRATGFGEGPIAVTMGFDNGGTVTGIIIGDENFMETEGRGDGVLADWYKAQFIGRSGVQTYGDGLDAISGATVTSEATLAAINACMSFDPAAPGTAAETAAPAGEPDAASAASETTAVVPDPNPPVPDAADAVTEASITEEGETEVVSSPAISGVVVTVPPAESAASGEADAVTEASIPEEEMTAPAAESVSTPAPASSAEADAVTEASIPEEETTAPAAEPVSTPEPASSAEADAVAEATIPEEEMTAPAAEPVSTPEPASSAEADAVTEASIPEEEAVR